MGMREQMSGRRKRGAKQITILILCSLLFTGCTSVGVGNTDIGEETVRLNAANVQITEEQYRQVEDIRKELRHIILDGADIGKLEDIYALLPQEDFQKAGSCYLSSKPLIEWDYENKDIYQIKLLAFSEDKSVCYFIMVDFDNGKVNYKGGGYESMDVDDDPFPKYSGKRFIGLRSDYYNSHLMSEDKFIYPADNLVLSRDEFFGQFDFGKMGVSFREARRRCGW